MDLESVDAQALRLVKAFYNVLDPAAREQIISMVEAAERGGNVAGDGADGRLEAGKGLDL